MIEAANPRSRHAGKNARGELGSLEKLTNGRVVDWKMLEKKEIEDLENGKAVAPRAKESACKNGEKWCCSRKARDSTESEGLLYADLCYALKAR